VRIGGVPYRVIGVVEHQGSILGFPLDRFVVVPALSPAQNLVNPPGFSTPSSLKARSDIEMREAMSQAEGIMRSRRHLRPKADNNFVLDTSEERAALLGRHQRYSHHRHPGNRPRVARHWRHRDHEHHADGGGGANAGDRAAQIAGRPGAGTVLRQFLAESTAISLVGASFGIVAGILLTMVINKITPLPASVSPLSVFMGALMGGLSASFSACTPRRAPPKLDPITALRQE